MQCIPTRNLVLLHGSVLNYVSFMSPKYVQLSKAWYLWMWPYMEKSFCQCKRYRDTDTEGKVHMNDDRCRYYRYVVRNQGIPEATRNWKRQKRFSPRILWGGVSVLTPQFQNSGLRNRKRINFCLFWKLPSMWYLITAVLGNEYIYLIMF